MVKTVAIIPAYNEEIALGSVIQKTLKYVDKVIVVDDGSSDKTKEIAKLAGAEVISHSKNLGKGRGLKSGFDFIKKINCDEKSEENYDIIITIDGDGQNNPDEIPRLIAPIESGEADFVNGSRYIERSKDDDTPKYRRVGQKVLDIATNISTRLKISDSQSGFRGFSKKAIPYFKMKESGFAIESEMLFDAAENGLKVVEVPISVRYDVGEATKNPISHGVKVLLKIIKELLIRRPLFFFTLLGIIIMIIILIGITIQLLTI